MIALEAKTVDADSGVRGASVAERLADIERRARQLADDAAALLEILAGSETDAHSADVLLPLAVAAQEVGVSKEAMRKRAKREGLAVKRGGRLHIAQAALGKLYTSTRWR